MPVRPRKSIEDYGGVLAYLDDPDIMEKHNGYGSEDLLKNRKHGPAFLRDMFGVKTTKTIYEWLAKVDKEHPSD